MPDNSPTEIVSAGEAAIHRIPIEYSAYFAVQAPAPGGDRPPALLIAMHGYGQSCKGFIKNFAGLREENFLVVAPQAVNQFYWERGKVGFTWLTRYRRDQTLNDTYAYLGRVLEAVKRDYVFDPSRVYLFGFSNGAGMAFRFGTNGMVNPAGIIACCGDLPKDVEERLPDLDRFPVLLLHGEEDSMVHAEKSRHAASVFRANDYEVETVYFQGGHELRPEEIDCVNDWLRAKAAMR